MSLVLFRRANSVWFPNKCTGLRNPDDVQGETRVMLVYLVTAVDHVAAQPVHLSTKA